MIPEENLTIDLGHGVRVAFTQWAPDRELNPQYKEIPDIDKYGLIYTHPGSDGEQCQGSIVFEGTIAHLMNPDRPRWSVESWEPLTVSPSLLCRRCGHHGFIQQGRWVPA